MKSNRKLIGIIAGIIVLFAWSGAASEWDGKDCSLSQGYMFTITHGGGPDQHEGCEESFGGNAYTDDYRG
ncbi:hypothetical protein [Streptomyces sp. NPDC002994]|uniref:hypothetical protein n=1 Tax=Streptomyces sp. NPDC002994 TaxID=3154441 RepID=UPI0033B67F4C